MSVPEMQVGEVISDYNTLLQSQQLRKAKAEADLAEALAQQEQAAAKAALKQVPDETASPGVVPQEIGGKPPQTPPDPKTPTKGSDAADPSKSEAKPREGVITLDEKAGYLTTVIAYRAMLRLADAAAAAIDALNLREAKILLVDSLEFAAADTAVLQLSAQIGAWKTELKRLNIQLSGMVAAAQKSPVPAGSPLPLERIAPAFVAGLAPSVLLPLLTGAVSATADLIGYFKTDYAISGRDVEVSDKALRARVAGKISGATVYWQDYYRIAQSPLLATFAQVTEQQALLRQNLDLLKRTVIDPLTARIVTLGAEIEALQAEAKALKLPDQAERKEELGNEIAELGKELAAAVRAKREPDLLYAQARAVLDVIDGNTAQLTAVPQGQQLSPLGRAALRDYLDVLGITHLLHASVVSAGGEVVTGKNWFLGAPQAGYLAGGVICYVLSQVDGAIVAADTLAGTDYLKFKLGQDVLS